MGKRLLCDLGILLVGIVAGFLLLTAVMAVPTDRASARNAETGTVIREEGHYPLEPYSRRQLDNYTDCVMLLEAGDEGKEPLLERVVEVYRTTEKGGSAPSTMADWPLDDGTETVRSDYARYWHGFLVTLRPAYLLLGYRGVRWMNLILQYGLLLAVLLLMQKRAPAALFPFLLMILLWAPTAIGMSLQFSSVYYLVLLTLLFLLLAPGEALAGERLCRLFLLAGMMTAYLDFLTYPTATLTAPLVLLLVRLRCGGTPPRQMLRLAARCVLLWFLGYVGMWAGKWAIAALFTRGEFVRSLWQVIRFRSSATDGAGEPITRLGSLGENVRALFENRHLLLLTGLYALSQLFLCWRRGRGRGFRDAGLLLFALPPLIAVGWNLALSNHSLIHSFFTYRTLGPALFAVLAALSLAAERPSLEGERDHG